MIETAEATNIGQILLPLVIIAGALLLGLVIARVILPLLQRLAQRTSWYLDDLLIHVLQSFIVPWFMMIGIYAATLGAPVGSRIVPIVRDAVLIAFILSMTFAAIRLGTGLVAPRIERDGPRRTPALSIILNVIRITLLGVGFSIALRVLNIPITPAVAAFGVGGLALSLAMQDTLSSVVSGILIILSRQIRPGNYIKLSTGEEGYVTDINWRTTQIRQLANNMVIVPNSVMTSAIVVNYYDPDKELAILIDVGVSYESDLARVEHITNEVGREVMQTVPGGVPEFEPFIRYNTFDDFLVKFTVILRGQEFVDQYMVKHEFIKRLHQRYRQEGIEIAIPIPAVHLGDSNHRMIAPFSPSDRPQA